MTERYEAILDECISLVLQGSTVDDCLRQYPEYATELEADLRVAAQMTTGAHFEPSATARERSRQRLEAELRQLQIEEWQRGPTRSGRASWFASAFRQFSPRWASAAAAVAVLAFGGIGTVSASSSSLPGDTLYPVKRVAEETRLTLSFSEQRKAEIELGYARRRAEEANELLQQGRPEPVEIAQANMNRHFDRAAARAANLDDEKAARVLSAQVQRDVSAVLGLLQDVARRGPEPMREHAQRLYERLSQELVETSMTLATNERSETVALSTGTIQFVATDAPEVDADQLLVTLGRIDAHRAGPQPVWLTLLDEPRTIDLVQIGDVEELLGEFEAEAGVYIGVRFDIAAVEVIKDGVSFAAAVPGGPENINRPFRVEPGVTTVIQLDFGGARSLRLLDDGQFRFRPLGRLYALEPDEEKDRERLERQEERDDQARDRSASRQQTDDERRIRVRGAIEEIEDGVIVINGHRVEVEIRPALRGRLERGAFVIIEVQGDRRGALGKGRIIDVREARPTSAAPARRPADGERSDRDEQRVSFRGVIREMRENRWRVGDRSVLMTEDTVIQGQPVIGAQAVVSGAARPDGAVQAARVLVLPARGEALPDARPRDDRRAAPQSDRAQRGRITRQPAHVSPAA